LTFPAPAPEADAAGFVLAGGRSSRMGTEKARLVLAAKALIERSLDTLRLAGLESSIAGARSDLSAFAPVVKDAAEDAGPLGGLCAAMAASPGQWAVFLPVDLPLLPASLLSFLLAHARATSAGVTVASVNGFVQTFPAILSKAVMPFLREEIESGRGSCIAAFRAAGAALGMSILPVELLAQAGTVEHPTGLPPAFWFLNVNTPEDLRRAEKHIRHRIA